jgi:acetate kinase
MKPSQTCILTIIGGSSSIKFALYWTDELLKRCLYGKIDRIGLPGTNLTFNDLTQNQQDSRGIKASDHRKKKKEVTHFDPISSCK